MRRLSALALALTLSLTTVAAAPTVAQTGCDPFQTPPEYDPAVPRFGFGETQMTVAEIDTYLTAVDDASNRVITAEAAKSVEGQVDPIRDRRDAGPGDHGGPGGDPGKPRAPA